VGRARWFIVGAAATAGVLVAAPGAYQRLRGLVAAGDPPLLEPGPAPEPAYDPPPAAAFATYEPPDPEAFVADEDTAELRLRIDETRDRIRRRAKDGLEADAEAE